MKILYILIWFIRNSNIPNMFVEGIATGKSNWVNVARFGVVVVVAQLLQRSLFESIQEQN